VLSLEILTVPLEKGRRTTGAMVKKSGPQEGSGFSSEERQKKRGAVDRRTPKGQLGRCQRKSAQLTVDHLEVGSVGSSGVDGALGDTRDLARDRVRAEEGSCLGEVGAESSLAVNEPASESGELWRRRNTLQHSSSKSEKGERTHGRGRVGEVLKRGALLRLPRDGGKKVILEVRSNTRKILDNGNSELLELRLRPNAGSEEKLRSAESSLRDDGLLFDANDPARSTFRLSDFDGSAATRSGGRRVEVEASNLSAGEDRKVLAKVDALGKVGGVGGGALAVVDDGLEAGDL
jgi:hypothetical protein